MDLNLPIFQDLTLKIADKPDKQKIYPTARLQKGLVMHYRGLDLAEEAVGFGLPVLKQGLQAIFPGNVKLELIQRDSSWVLTAMYTMNLVEKIARPGSASLKSKYLYAAKNTLADFIRRFPLARAPLTGLSNGLRSLFGWETTFEDAGSSGQVRMVYTVHEPVGILLVEADTGSLSNDAITEVTVMNEQGAHFFNQYHDSSGTCLSGEKIGCWDQVTAEEAGFVSYAHGVAFSLRQVAGARLFRGRELIGSRLAWAGFGYSFSPSARGLSYRVKLEKLP